MPQPTLSQFIKALPQPVVLVESDGFILDMNQGAVTLLGADLVGRHYVTALRQPALLEVVEAVLGDGTDRHSRYLATEGRKDTFWSVDVTATGGPEGRCAVLLFTDKTELAEVLQMRRDFVANVSHELRTPITAILGFVETLQGPAATDATARDRFLSVMQTEAQRMQRLVDDLLLLNRVEQNERRRPVTPVDLSELIRETVAAMEPAVTATDAKIEVNLPPNPPKIPAEADQLRQALGNLVENALKYGQSGGVVTITLQDAGYETQLQGQGIRLSVSDKGPGIAAHHIPRLTERFYRVDEHRDRASGGTGLGLAIVKHIMNRHRGRLLIESVPGQGTTFTLLLPLA